MAANKISQAERERLEAAFPGLPKSYFDHLRHAGWGETKNGRMLYSGPVAAEEIYGASNELDTILLIGDDMQGYCVGFDSRTGQAVEVSDSGVATPIDDGFLAEY